MDVRRIESPPRKHQRPGRRESCRSVALALPFLCKSGSQGNAAPLACSARFVTAVLSVDRALVAACGLRAHIHPQSPPSLSRGFIPTLHSPPFFIARCRRTWLRSSAGNHSVIRAEEGATNDLSGEGRGREWRSPHRVELFPWRHSGAFRRGLKTKRAAWEGGPFGDQSTLQSGSTVAFQFAPV